MKTNHPVISEIVLPAAAHIIGRLAAQVGETEGIDALTDKCRDLWNATIYLNRLAVICSMTEPGPKHFSIAAVHEMGRVALFIHSEIGYDPLSDKPKCEFWL